MHGQLKRRLVDHSSHLELQRRQAYDDVLDDTGHSHDSPIHADPPLGTGIFITGPLTFVVTRTITPSIEEPSQIPDPTPDYHYEASPTLTSVQAPTSEPVWTGIVIHPPSSSPPRATSTSLERPSNAGELDLETASTGVPSPISAAATKQGPLPSGAVIGLIIAGIAICVALIFFFVRRRYVQRRIRLRKEWARSKPVSSMPLSEPKPSFEERQGAAAVASTPISPFAPRPALPANGRSISPSRPSHYDSPTMDGRGAIPATRPTRLAPLVIPPPASYGTEFSPALSTHRTSDPYAALLPAPTSKKPTSPVKKLLTPIYGPPATVLSKPVSAMVISTFITTLPDELHITVGETIQIVSEFDDGWAMCVNVTGEQGMVPVECLDKGSVAGNHGQGLSLDLNRTLGGRAKRVSSLRPAMVGVRRF